MNIEYEYKIDSNTKNLNKDLGATTRHIHVLAKIIISYHKIEKKPASIGATIRHVGLLYIKF